MLLGYAMTQSSEDELFMGILPFSDIEGGNTEMLGHFLQFTETILPIHGSARGKENPERVGRFSP